MVHGEQYTELYKPLAPRDSYCVSACVADILDKGSGAVAILNGMMLSSVHHLSCCSCSIVTACGYKQTHVDIV